MRQPTKHNRPLISSPALALLALMALLGYCSADTENRVLAKENAASECGVSK